MQLREKPREGQLSINGNVVNVPTDVMSTVNKLPRMLTEDETIAFKFNRSLNFKHSVAFERIRPNKVLNAANWLVENSELFRNEGIQINNNWLTNYSNEESQERICFEDSSPISVFKDINSEFLAFPTIYCGKTRPDNKDRVIPLHYSTLCKWELRNVDRRCATYIPNIFFKMKKLQIKQIQDKVSLAVRKCKLKGKKYSVAQILDSTTADSIVRLNEGYHVLRNLRGSPPYWEKAKKDVFAMIRQLGFQLGFVHFQQPRPSGHHCCKHLED